MSDLPNPEPNKKLGQHWLSDQNYLDAIVQLAELDDIDTVLEVGPGLGFMTELLCSKSGQVIAVELDQELATSLAGRISVNNLQVVEDNILDYNLNQLPVGYKVVANIPYYLTSNLIRRLLEASNKPAKIVLLVQKEVALRLAAKAGQMSILSLAAQIYSEVSLGPEVPASAFDPPPKVDSQVVVLEPYMDSNMMEAEIKSVFRLAKAGFNSRRKKLRSSLAALGCSKTDIDSALIKSGLDASARPQELSVQDWQKLSQNLTP